MMTAMTTRRAADPTAMTPGYRIVTAITAPIMRPWSRLSVRGLDCLPPTGPVLLVGNHDSYWDPMAVAVAARGVRQIYALAKSSLWKNKVVGALMSEMGQIPVERGASNAAAMRAALDALRNGACIGVFPEGTRSLGRELRARSGVGRLAQAVPEATVVCARITGSVDVVRVPKRPRIDVEFFRPAGGPLQPGESATAFAQRLLDEVRAAAPRAIPGRRRTAAKYRERLATAPPPD
jgi:1-acyl-sn-glycerol-3-phosphate acyltransferase